MLYSALVGMEFLKTPRMSDSPRKVLLITGAASGIGLAIAGHFAAADIKVMMTDRDLPLLQKECRLLQDKGFDTEAVVCDVTSQKDIQEAVALTIRRFGTVDILINNAGLQYVSLIEDFPVEKFEQMIRVMLTAPFMLIREILPVMKKQQYGRIINMASINGLIGFAGKSAYNSAKHGLIGLTKVTALEGAAFGITANAICPGYVDTPLVRGQFKDLAKTRNTTENRILEEVIFPLVPQKRLITLEEIAQTALFLASDAASGITGQPVVIDGGYTAQ